MILYLRCRQGQIKDRYGAFIKEKDENDRQIWECVNNHMRKKWEKVYKDTLIDVKSVLF